MEGKKDKMALHTFFQAKAFARLLMHLQTCSPRGPGDAKAQQLHTKSADVVLFIVFAAAFMKTVGLFFE